MCEDCYAGALEEVIEEAESGIEDYNDELRRLRPEEETTGDRDYIEITHTNAEGEMVTRTGSIWPCNTYGFEMPDGGYIEIKARERPTFKELMSFHEEEDDG